VTQKKVSMPNHLIQQSFNPQFGQNFVDKMNAVTNKEANTFI
jgi:hypothetical protein